MTLWRYEARMLSKRGTRVTGYVQVIQDWEYQIPMCRDFIEKKCEAALRGMEGVTPETPIEHVGWRQEVMGDAK